MKLQGRPRYREHLINIGVALAAIILPSLLAWVTIGAVLGAL